MSDDETMDAVRSWAEQLASQLGLDEWDLDIDAVLATAGLAARAVVRPAAPVTTYLIGCAVGRAGHDPAARSAAFASALAAVAALAEHAQADRAAESSPGDSA